MSDATNRIFATGFAAARAAFNPTGALPPGSLVIFWEEDTKELYLWEDGQWGAIDLSAPPESR